MKLYQKAMIFCKVRELVGNEIGSSLLINQLGSLRFEYCGASGEQSGRETATESSITSALQGAIETKEMDQSIIRAAQSVLFI